MRPPHAHNNIFVQCVDMWPHISVLFVHMWTVHEHFTPLLRRCCAVSLTVASVHGTLLTLTFPPPFQQSGNRAQSVLPLTAAMIFSATHTGDNEFELDGVPLGQVGRVWGERRIVRRGGKLRGASEDMHEVTGCA